MDKELDEYSDSVTTSHSENTELYTNDVLVVKARGFYGLLEDIPLWAKLLAMWIVAVAGLIALAVFLLSIQGSTLKKAYSAKEFGVKSGLIGNLITKFQDERDITNTILFSEIDLSANDSQRYLDELYFSYKETDLWIEKMNSRVDSYLSEIERAQDSSGGQISRLARKLRVYKESIDALSFNRDMVSSGSIGGADMSLFYTNAINSLIQALTYMVQETNTPTANLFVDFIRIYELQQQIKAQGLSQFILGRISAISSRQMAEKVAIRNYLMEQWLSSASELVFGYYESNVDSGLTEYLSQIELALTIFRDCLGPRQPIIGGYTLEMWNDNNLPLSEGMKTVKQLIIEQFLREGKRQYDYSTILIVAIIVIVVVFMIMNIFAPLIIAYTIIGPWKRLNRIQKAAISKFVPQALLGLIGVSDITEVSLGNFKEKQLTMVAVDLKDFAKKTSKMDPKQVLDYFNSFLSHVGPLVRRNGGFITNYNSNGFVALFRTPKDGVKTSIALQKNLEMYNAEIEGDAPTIEIGVSVQSGKMLVGTVGENERMEGAVFGHSVRLLQSIEPMIEKFKLGLLTSMDVISKSKKHVEKHLRYRKCGIAKIENALGGDEFVEVVEILNYDPRGVFETKLDFETALDYFHSGSYSEAYELFTNVSIRKPEDTIAKIYQLKSYQLMNECKIIASDLNSVKILADDVLRRGLYDHCNSEHSIENISLWQDIEKFKSLDCGVERRLMADKLYFDYFTKDGKYEININQSLKDLVQKRMNENLIAVGTDLFDEVKIELEVLMNDTCSRFKTKSVFFKWLTKSACSPRKLWLNDF